MTSPEPPLPDLPSDAELEALGAFHSTGLPSKVRSA